MYSEAEKKLLLDAAIRAKEESNSNAWSLLTEKLYQLEADNIHYLCNYCELLSQKNLHREALALLQKHQGQPTNHEEHYQLTTAQAKLHQQLGNFDEATKLFRKATQEHANNATSWLNQGLFLEAIGKTSESEQSLAQANKIKPNTAEIIFPLIRLLEKNDKQNEAQDILKICQPNQWTEQDLYFFIEALIKTGATKQAEVFLDEVHLNRDNEPKWRYLKAKSYLQCGNISAYADLMDTMPEVLLEGNSRSKTEAVYSLFHAGETHRARQELQTQLRMKHYDPRLHFISAHNLLLDAQYEEGWEQYEHRHAFATALHHQTHGIPLEKNLEGEDVLVIGEQGIGEMLFFSNFLDKFKDNVGSVAVLCEHKIGKLLANSFKTIRFIDNPEDLSIEDHQRTRIAIGSLPFYLYERGYTDQELIKPVYTLHIAKQKTQYWENWLKQNSVEKQVLKIGLSLQGGNKMDLLGSHARAINPELIFKTVPKGKAHFYDIQHNHNHEEIKVMANQYGHAITDMRQVGTDLGQLAAFMKSLDLVITSQQTNAHLCGISQIPAFVLLPPFCHFAFGRKELSPWYPSLKLIRAKKPGNWIDGMATICEALNL